MAARTLTRDGEGGTTEGPRYDDVLCSPTSEAQFLVIDPGAANDMPSLNGAVMYPGRPQACSTAADGAAESELRGGQRYVDVVTDLTLLCIRPGSGQLRYQGRSLTPESSPMTFNQPAGAG
jgi:hypothetical protein